MSGVDLSKVKPGDEVTVRAIVADIISHSNWGLHFQHINGAYDGCAKHFVAPECIVSHTPKALAVGDRVRHQSYEGTLEAICGKHAWVVAKSVGHEGKIVRLSELERLS